jgi:erythromycin esterase-like protein
MGESMHRAALTAAIVVAVLFLVSCSGGGDTPANPEIAWLDQHLVPLDGADPTLDLQDLAPLADSIGDARVVGLGESTHGTREHFQLKHRLVRYLVEEHGFDIFAIEAGTPEAHRLDAYVLGGEGDPRELIAGMYFWTWNTEEVLAMVEWMREHNARSEHKIHFTGFDMQTPDVAAAEVVAFVERVDPPRAGRLKDRFDALVATRGGSEFATATYVFPVDQARGKTVRFSAWIRTEDVTEGFAGLWWRVDGPDNQVLAFDNMRNRGITGTTGWAEYTVELDAPATATNTVFGFMLTGTGRAWFDDAAIALDGERQALPALDLAFEGPVPAARHLPREGAYVASLDREVVHGGEQSLLLSRVGETGDAGELERAAEEAGAIHAELAAQRDAWCEQLPAAEVDRALLYARIVHQCLRLRTAGNLGGAVRGQAMAENVAWLAEQHPDARIVLWAHNYHVSREAMAMGRHLANEFGGAYLPVGFATASGRYYAVGNASSRGKRVHDLQPPPPDSFEARFVAARAPVFALDLRRAREEDPASRWLLETHPFRSVGAMAIDEQFGPTALGEMYDLVVFADATEEARQLGGAGGRR